MSYSVKLQPAVVRQIAGWGLSNFMLVEVYIRLREDLATQSAKFMLRDPSGAGYLCVFDARDPGDPDFNQIFMFRVFIGQDEEHLFVTKGSYWGNFDPIHQG